MTGKQIQAAFLSLGMMALMASAVSAETIQLDKTNSTQGWVVYKDKLANGAMKVASGPNSSVSALQFDFDLSGGTWVAFVKKVPDGMPGMKAITFTYRGSGIGNFEVKVKDTSGGTFGLRVPAGIATDGWMNLVIPIEYLVYLWGGTSKELVPKNIEQFEVAVSMDSDGGPGKMWVANIGYSTSPMEVLLTKKVSGPGAEAEKGGESKDKVFKKMANIEIAPKTLWAGFADKGASIDIDVYDDELKAQKALNIQYTWGERAVPGVTTEVGVWVAAGKDISMDLSDMRNFEFSFKGSGAVANLEVKFVDQFGARFGRVFPSGSIAGKWTTVTIPRTDFTYMWGGDQSGKFDWSHVSSIEFALSRTSTSRNSGTFQLSDMKFTSALSRDAAGPAAKKPLTQVSDQMNVVIDDFTELNPSNRYYTVLGDDSTLELSSSRITFQSGYSLRMRYNLKSSQPTGSWVEAQRRFSPALDWTGTENIRVWVKGDASRNTFRLTVTDATGRKWISENSKILTTTDWYLVDMSVDDFIPIADLNALRPSGLKLKQQLNTIRQIGVGILSLPDQTSNPLGEIFIEKLYISGKNINPATAVPLTDRAPVGIALPLKNWNIGGTSESVLVRFPTQLTSLQQNVKLQLTGNFQKFSVFGEMELFSDFGNADNDIVSDSALVRGSNVIVTLLDLVPGLNNIVIGNLWFNSSPHILANDNQYGGWGYKGIQTEGWLDRLHHRTYFIKSAPNSYSLAGHYALALDWININAIGTYFNRSPYVESATQLELDDKAFLIEVSKLLAFPKVVKMNLSLRGGYDWYQKYWDPTTLSTVDQTIMGGYYEGEVNLSDSPLLFWPGLSLTGAYRKVEPGFKPEYRQSPGSWDIEVGDTAGFLGRVYQSLGGAFISATYYHYDRISDSSDYTENKVFSIGYNDWRSMDIALTQEFLTRIYHYVDERYLIDGDPARFWEDRRETKSKFSLAYHFNGAFTIQEEVEFKLVNLIDTDEDFSELFSTMRLTYSPSPNMTITLENRFSRYGREQDRPIIDFSDTYTWYEYTRLRLNLTF